MAQEAFLDILHDITWVLPLRSGPATLLAEAFTALGYTGVVLAIVPLGYWLLDKALFVRIGLLVILSAAFNGFFKDLIRDPRPPTQFALDHREDGTYGLPSGHAQLTTVLWCWLAIELKRPWLWGLAAMMIVAVSSSRLYLGVHDLEDVLGGFVVGVAVMGLFVFLISDRCQRWRQLHPAFQIAALLAVQPLIYRVWPWGEPGGRFAIGGLLIGWWAGVLAERRYVHFQRHPNWVFAIGGAILAMALIYLPLLGISGALVGLGVGSTAALWLQLCALGLFVSVGAPWLFVRTGLAVQETALN